MSSQRSDRFLNVLLNKVELFTSEVFVRFTLLPSIPLILLAIVSVDPNLWIGSELHHFYIELLAVIFSGVIAFYYILHAQNLKDRFSLFIGIGFAVSACIDLLHVVVSFGLMENMAFLKYFIPQTWFAGRIFLSSMLLIAIAKYSRILQDVNNLQVIKNKEEKSFHPVILDKSNNRCSRMQIGIKVNRTLITYLLLLGGVTYGIALGSFFFVLPASVLDDYSIHRPYEVPPLILFFVALLFFYKRKLYLKKDIIYKGIMIYLLVDIFSQAIMSYSTQSFDTAHNMAHVLKDVGYFVNIIALAISGIRYTMNLKERNELIQIQFEKIKASEKLKDEFINIAAHELRTPIQPILALSIFLYNKNGSINDYKEHIEIIIKNSKRLQKLSEEILDASRIESHSLTLNFEQFDIFSVIRTLIQDYASQLNAHSIKLRLFDKNNEIELGIADQSCSSKLFVVADKNRIIQVVSNILINSLKYTRTGEITVTIHKDIKFVLIKIIDSGSGIDQEILPRLFEKFITGSPTGTGLGLYICRNIVEAHGGNIWAQNNEGKNGATFAFVLPLINQ